MEEPLFWFTALFPSKHATLLQSKKIQNCWRTVSLSFPKDSDLDERWYALIMDSGEHGISLNNAILDRIYTPAFMCAMGTAWT